MTPQQPGALWARLHPSPTPDQRPEWVRRAERRTLPAKEHR